MKKIFYLLCILLSGLYFSQSTLNQTWYLQKMKVNGVDYFPQSIESIAEITYDTSWGDVMTKICMQRSFNMKDITSTSYTINQYSGIAGSCSDSSITDFQTIYFGAFQKAKNYVHNYVVSGSGTSAILTVTTSAGDIFVYGTQKILSTNDIAKSQKYIFPNLVKDYINLKNLGKIDFFSLYDMNGKLILEQKNVYDKINLSHLPNGTYIVYIEKNGEKHNMKIIKN